jgi:hypothetical protein
MVYRIGSDRVTYPLPLNETNPSASSSESSSIPDLTNGLGIALYKRGGALILAMLFYRSQQHRRI